MTNQTFLALIQTTSGLIELATFLLTKKSYQYVLLGKFQSDPIESRFGWYRQLAGANYYLSVRQLLEAEKCIQLKSLLKFSKHSLEDLKEAMEDIADQRKEDIDCGLSGCDGCSLRH